jgi:hypothetical protein
MVLGMETNHSNNGTEMNTTNDIFPASLVADCTARLAGDNGTDLDELIVYGNEFVARRADGESSQWVRDTARHLRSVITRLDAKIGRIALVNRVSGCLVCWEMRSEFAA